MDIVDITTDDACLQTFRRKESEYYAAVIPDEYRKRGIVRAGLLGGRMVGGYSLAVAEPLRCVEALKANDAVDALGLPVSAVAEVSGLWIEKAVRKSLDSARLWENMIQALEEKGKTHIIYGYDAREETLRKIYGRGKPKILFRGKLSEKTYEKMTPTTAVASIELVSVDRLRRAWNRFYGPRMGYRLPRDEAGGDGAADGPSA
jgi:hypothetical protein